MKRYQVFISSTYEDLKDERLEVSNAILSIDSFPAGMELFPAANEEQFSYIKKIIEQSDYYVLIIGGRYGSTDACGISYTEKEFDYAVKIGVPVLAYIRKNIDEIPAKYVEHDTDKKNKLEAFKKKVCTNRLISYWSDKNQLATKVITGLEKAFISTPRIGMVRASEMDTEELSAEYLKSLKDNAKRQESMLINLQNEIEKNRVILESFNFKKNFYDRKGVPGKKWISSVKKRDIYKDRVLKEYQLSDERVINELVIACEVLQKIRRGALIVIEKKIPLTDYINTGIYLDCIVSNHIIRELFEHHGMFHEGATIIRGGRIISSTCYLPLTDNIQKWGAYGTRHRAALGISEVADCVTIVISEETGNISVTHRGEISEPLDFARLQKLLSKLLMN